MAMAAILALFTSIQSLVHHPVSRFNLLYTFIISTLLLPCSLSCNNNQTCGGVHIQYPFGLRQSGCGLPQFQIDCVQDARPVIQIDSQSYTLIKIFYDNRSSIIVQDKYFNECSFLDTLFDLKNYSSIFDGILPLRIAIEVRLCLDQLLCALDAVSLPCPLELVTVNGGLARWDITGKPLFQKCISCNSNGGLCGYDISNPGHFLCFCGDESHPDQCSTGQRSNQGIKTDKTITGIAIGASAFIMVVALFLIIVCRKRLCYFKWIQTCGVTEPMNSGSIVKVEKFLQSYIQEMPTRYSFSQLKKITNNFADKLGEGGFGVVYKGKLRSGFWVAVKVLDQSRQSERQFMNEVATLGTIHHVHLVRLMGYCFEGFRSALVYEYMANGSLEKFLFAEKGKEQMLNWNQLYSIALGAARGIAYLHEDCSRRIIHFDIKPHNILLDEDFTPKVADFGLAKLYGKAEDHVSMTGGRGTPGYAAPEVWSRNLGAVTEKSDVYSFGMLLLEIAGRRKNIEVQASRSSQLYFPEWAFKLIESGELERRLRERGTGGEMKVGDEEKVRRMAKVGLWCIQYTSVDRPSMSRIVEMLEGRDDDVSNPPLPFNSNSSHFPPCEAAGSSSTEISSFQV